jgi:acyl carrier protein
MYTGDLMQRELLASSLRTFITGHFPATKRRELRNDDSLLETGMIDSLGVLDLVSFIETEFQITVADEDLTPENFQTIEKMMAFVDRKRNGEA